jgi:adenylate cyclase
LAWPRATREAGLALVVATAALLGLTLGQSAVLRGLETASLDLRFRLRGAVAPGAEIAAVMVDDASLAALGRWPLSRHLFATALRRIDAAGARVVVFDLLFAEPDQPVAADLREAARQAAGALPADAAPGLRAGLDRLAGDDPDGDFAAAIRASGKVLLPLAFDFAGKPAPAPPALEDQFYQRLDTSAVQPLFPLQPRSAVTPLAAFVAASAGLGHVNIAYDEDGAPRYDYLALPYDGEFMPSLPVRAAAAYLGVKWGDVGLALGDGVSIGRLRVPTDPAMRLVVNYRGPRGTIPTYPFVDLIRGRVPAAALRDRIVLVGASFIGIADTNPAPFGNTPLPGTERMADIIDSMLAADFIRESPPPWPVAVIGLVALLALATGIAAALVPTRLALAVGLVPVAAWSAGAQLAFVRGLWLPVVDPLIALAAAAVSVLLFRYGFVDHQRRHIQAAFRHYLAPDLVNALAAHPERLKLGGETREISVMFADIRGFTSIAEGFKANPEGLSRLINRSFLSPMTRTIMARRGTIDKYMGDCVMAFWNAPLDEPGHADRACETALAMVAELERINRAGDGPAIAIGVGVNTGECVVGNMGSDERFAYTAMGDAVNLASRLEGQTKTYHVAIVIGEATRAAAPSWAALELDLIAVKGRSEAVKVYALMGDAEFAAGSHFRALEARHQAMLAAYRAQNWREAAAALEACRDGDARLAGLYELYAARIEFYSCNPPGPLWDGVFIAETK